MEICKEGELCGGRRWIWKGKDYVECTCGLRLRAKRYLGQEYGPEITWVRKYDWEKWDQSVLAISPVEIFKQHVKSALLCSGMIWSHLTVSPYDIVDRCFGMGEEKGKMDRYQELLKTDVLIVIFHSDPPNKTYGDILTSVVERREYEKKKTWVCSVQAIESAEFVKKYVGNSQLGKRMKRFH